MTQELLQKALRAAQDYTLATGIPCNVIDEAGNSVGEFSCMGFCGLSRDILSSDLNCQQSHLFGAYQAEQFGGKYIYFCPLSLIHWASPLMEEGMMAGALIGGPVLAMDHEEYISVDLEKILSLSSLPADMQNSLKEQIREITYVQTERVSALSEILRMMAGMVSGLDFRREASEGLLQQQSRISDYIQYIKTMEGTESAVMPYPIDKERELTRLIGMGDKKGSQKVLNEVLGAIFFTSGNNFPIIKSRILELVVILSRAAMEGGADIEQIFGMNFNYLNQIHNYSSIDQLAYWLSQIMHRFIDLVFDLKDIKHADAMSKAIHFINQNYTRKVSLDEVADHVFLSPTYFSKIFKDEMQCNYNHYLNQVRIDKSKDLLKNTRISLVDIASLVGFEDQSYFSKVFKKLSGISPGKYRERNEFYPSQTMEIHD